MALQAALSSAPLPPLAPLSSLLRLLLLLLSRVASDDAGRCERQTQNAEPKLRHGCQSLVDL